MRQHVLGILAVLLLVVAIYGWSTYGMKESQSSVFFSSCQRIGLVFGAAWLAYPQLVRISTRVSARFMLMMVAVGLVILARPRTVVILGPIMLVLAALQFTGWLMTPLPPTTGSSRQVPANPRVKSVEESPADRRDPPV
jgi:hypothetical protein